MLPWLALTFTAARLGFEAQNAAAFRFMRLGSRPETAAGEIIPHAASVAGAGPSSSGRRTKTSRGRSNKKASRREDVQKVGVGQAATQAGKRALIVCPRRRDSSD